MKINVEGAYNLYGKKLTGESRAAKSGSSGGSKKTTDVAEFSRGSTAIADKGLMTLKVNIQHDINRSASPERLEQIRTDIKNGTYHVSTEALVDSILSD